MEFFKGRLLLRAPRQVVGVAVFPGEPVFSPDSPSPPGLESRGQGGGGSQCWASVSNISNACSIDFRLWFMEIALYLNHILQLGRILISTLPSVSMYKSHLYLSLLCPLFSKCSTLCNLLYQQFYYKPRVIQKRSGERQMEIRHFHTHTHINYSILSGSIQV